MNLDPHRILVTGGSGFLGINLIRHLLSLGYDISSIDFAAFDYPEKDRVRTHLADIRDRAAVDEAMQGADAVVHCAAALPLYPPAEIYSTDVEGTRNVLQSALDHGVRRVVHISTTAVYGIPDHHPLLESDPMRGVGPYGDAKIRAEGVAAEFRARGLTVPVIRPKSFVGPERLGAFAMLYEWAAEGHGFPLTGSGRNRYQLLDVEDLCRAIHLCLTLPDAVVNDIFNIGAAEFRTLREDYQAVLDRAGHGRRIVCFPATPVIWGLRALELLHLSPLYKWIYDTAHQDSYVAVANAQQILEWTPVHSNREALLRNYDWYLAHR
ncbi:MAG TPA: NAD(P)-dependent oxidoreductase, partial [Thermoanaerobaculaceae bacterium]|nr:NAD(P)-dependent oxidoreductase [Thermoanaerobaculaceae bacterium]